MNTVSTEVPVVPGESVSRVNPNPLPEGTPAEELPGTLPVGPKLDREVDIPVMQTLGPELAVTTDSSFSDSVAELNDPNIVSSTLI